MLDTHGRKYVQPLFNKLGKVCVKHGLKPIPITFIALGFGILTCFFIGMDLYLLGIIALWISGIFDVLDGTVARLTGTSSDFGAFLDITFDRLVELGIIMMLALKFPEQGFPFLMLTATIVLSMTIFLTIGGFAKNHTEKSFYYQAGMAERTEGFVFFTLMMLLPQYIMWIIYVFATTILITSIQRFMDGVRLLRD